MLSLGMPTLPKPKPGKIAIIKEWVALTFELDESATVFVKQLECKEAGCPPVETVIAISNAGKKSLQFKTHKSVNDIEINDIRKLL